MAAKDRRKASNVDKDPKGLYSTLDVDLDADVADIRKAYRRLALRWHPDKNPDDPEATAQFQKISAAYEVLSDPDKRSLYDRTGCMDEEELDETGAEHFKDVFAAFFGGAGCGDLDLDEQAMLDELLMGGHFAFRRKPRKGRKGKGRAGGGPAMRGMMQEELFMGQVIQELFGGMGMGGDPMAKPKCPQGHGFKRRKADDDYECDACGKDILKGKRLFDCRKCDYSLCQKCYKAKQQEMEREMEPEDSEGEENEALEQLIADFIEDKVEPVRQGNHLKFRCTICRKMKSSHEEVVEHICMEHEDVLEEALEAAQG